jgi:hypothetical protein
MQFIRLLIPSVLVLLLWISLAIAQQKVSVSSEVIQDKSLQRSEQGRFLKWLEKGYIPVYRFGETQIPILIGNTTYQIDLSEILQKVLHDLQLEIFMLPIPEFRIVSQPEEGAIWFGIYEDSNYLKRYKQTNTALDPRVLSRSYGGITFVIDEKGHALDFDPDYVDKDFEHVECLIAHPQYYANFNRSIHIAGRDRQELQFESPIDKVKLTLQAMAKHEFYHALGTKHVKDCTPRGQGRRNCTIMASSALMVFIYPGLAEFEQLTKVWEATQKESMEPLSQARTDKASKGIPY